MNEYFPNSFGKLSTTDSTHFQSSKEDKVQETECNTISKPETKDYQEETVWDATSGNIFEYDKNGEVVAYDDDLLSDALNAAWEEC